MSARLAGHDSCERWSRCSASPPRHLSAEWLSSSRTSTGDVLGDGDSDGESGARGGRRLVGGKEAACNRAGRTFCYGENRYKSSPLAIGGGRARLTWTGLVTR